MAVAVVGAGIAGLGAAYTLKRAGVDATVFEAEDRVGGRMKTVRRHGFAFDTGAFLLTGSYTAVKELIDELGVGCTSRMMTAAFAREGEHFALDAARPVRSFASTRLLSPRSKLRLWRVARDLHRHRHALGRNDAAALADLDTETVADYCERALDDELRDYVARPVVALWGGTPEHHSMVHLLWTLRLLRRNVYGTDGGMDALPAALAERLDVRLAARVREVAESGGGVDVTFAAGGGERTERFERAILTTPTDVTLEVYPALAGVARGFFEHTTYMPIIDGHLGLARPPRRSELLVLGSPRDNPDLGGVVADHLKARGRVPPGKGGLTIYTTPDWSRRNADADDERVLHDLLQMVRPHYGDLIDDIEAYEISRWDRTGPDSPPGRFREIAAYERSIDPSAPVQLAGDFHTTGGIEQALRSGQAAARRVLATARG